MSEDSASSRTQALPERPVGHPLQQTFVSELIKASSRLLLALMIVVIIFWLRAPIAAVLDRSTKIGIGPVSIEAAQATLKKVKVDPGASIYFDQSQAEKLTSLYTEALAATPKAKVLWVDDNPANNRALVDFLEYMGVSVTIVRSTPEALREIEARSFHAVVSDYNRPDDPSQQAPTVGGDWGAGAQLARALQQSQCGRKVLLFSASSTDDQPIPPGVRTATNSFYQLLIDLAYALREPGEACYVQAQQRPSGLTQERVSLSEEMPKIEAPAER